MADFLTLAKLRDGDIASVTRLDAPDEDGARLKALGICTGRRVQLVQGGDPLIVRVLGTRVGLSARLAAGVAVHAEHNAPLH